MVMKLC